MAGDFGDNGILDLAVVRPGQRRPLDPDGQWRRDVPARRVDYPVGGEADAIVAGDFSDDGNLDLAVANFDGDDVSILMGHGDGTFRPP